METVKVDTQKLQLLNERIAQTLDALNQLRMSAHAIQQSIQHTPAVSPWGYNQYGAYAAPSFAPPAFYGSPVAATQSFVPPYAMPPYAASPFGGAPYVGIQNGIQHTTASTGGWTGQWTPGGWTPGTWTNAWTPGWSSGAWSMPWTGNGISHSSWDPTRTGLPTWQHPYQVTIS